MQCNHYRRLTFSSLPSSPYFYSGSQYHFLHCPICPSFHNNFLILLYPRSTGGGVCCFTPVHPSFRPSVCPSVRPKIFFVAFFSATIDGRNLIFCHKLHIGIPYRGKRFWTRNIPCLPTWLVFFYTH